jgi:predicted PurR-regulated permease PerM
VVAVVIQALVSKVPRYRWIVAASLLPEVERRLSYACRPLTGQYLTTYPQHWHRNHRLWPGHVRKAIRVVVEDDHTVRIPVLDNALLESCSTFAASNLLMTTFVWMRLMAVAVFLDGEMVIAWFVRQLDDDVAAVEARLHWGHLGCKGQGDWVEHRLKRRILLDEPLLGNGFQLVDWKDG